MADSSAAVDPRSAEQQFAPAGMQVAVDGDRIFPGDGVAGVLGQQIAGFVWFVRQLPVVVWAIDTAPEVPTGCLIITGGKLQLLKLCQHQYRYMGTKRAFGAGYFVVQAGLLRVKQVVELRQLITGQGADVQHQRQVADKEPTGFLPVLAICTDVQALHKVVLKQLLRLVDQHHVA